MPNCGCIWVGDYDGPAFFKDSEPVARKEHHCCECNRVIARGERYENARGVWDGNFETHKTCMDCVSLRSAFFCDGWLYGQIWEDFEQHAFDVAGEIKGDCLSRLTPRAREKACAIIEEVWKDIEDRS